VIHQKPPATIAKTSSITICDVNNKPQNKGSKPMWFRHPKPFIQKPVATQTVKRSSEAPPATNSITVDKSSADTAAPDIALPRDASDTTPIRFAVTYTLRDYLTVLREHVSMESARRSGKKLGALTRATLPIWVTLIGLPMYVIKRLHMPVCDFRIDDDGVSRSSAKGTQTKPWNELVEARAYSGSYLLVFKRGAMPVPYRCLSAQQVVRMRALLAQVQA